MNGKSKQHSSKGKKARGPYVDFSNGLTKPKVGYERDVPGGKLRLEYEKNKGHKSDPSAKAKGGIIVSALPSGLPDIRMHNFVNPNQSLFGPTDGGSYRPYLGKGIGMTPVGVASTRARDIFDNEIFGKYDAAFRNRVRFNASFTLASLYEYFNALYNGLSYYYYVKQFFDFSVDTTTRNFDVNVRHTTVHLEETSDAMQRLKNTLETMYCPPRLHEFIKWMFGFHVDNTAPGTCIRQFVPISNAITGGTSVTAMVACSDDATLATALLACASNLRVAAVNGENAKMGALRPDWGLKLGDMPSSPVFEENWMNVWINSGAINAGTGGTSLPVITSLNDQEVYHMVNDDPNVVCGALWDGFLSGSQAVGLIVITGVSASSQVVFIDENNGVLTTLALNEFSVGVVRTLWDAII